MLESITETFKKINTELKGGAFWSIFLSLFIILGFLWLKISNSEYGLYKSQKQNDFSFLSSEIRKESLSNVVLNKFIYASKKGKKYYFYNCKSTIKEANKIFFDTEDLAQKAGYSLAKACK